MFCLSKRTVLFCCLFVVSLANVAGRNTTDDDVLNVSPRAGKLRHHRHKEKLLPKDCGIDNPSYRIYGGAKTDIDEHPWVGLLVYRSDSGFSVNCGATLISKRYALTDAHCANRTNFGLILKYVILGAWNISASMDCPASEGGCDPPHQNIGITEIIIHEKYKDDEHQLHDIALLRLRRDARFDYFVKPICLPLTIALRKSVQVGEELDVVGWGYTENTIKEDSSSNVKHKVPVPVVSNAECAEFYYSKLKRIISNSQICAGGVGGRDSCRGDSGGPLTGRRGDIWILFGIVSYGPSPCGFVGWPAVYTRVGAYVDWILSKLKP